MVYGSKQVGENRYREDVGRYFEDFKVGDIYEHRPGRTISEADNTWFTLLTLNTNQVHFNAEYAAKTEWGKTLVNSGLTVAIVLGQSVTDTSQNAIANLGWDEVRFPAPVLHGDTIRVESEVKELRDSKSRPQNGIVVFEHRAYNQRDELVAICKRSGLMLRKPKS